MRPRAAAGPRHPAPRHGVHRCTSAVTEAGTGVPASTDHGEGSGAPATTRNGTTPDHASVSSSGTEGPPRALLEQPPARCDRQLHGEGRDLLAPRHRPHLGGPARDQPLREQLERGGAPGVIERGELAVDDRRAVVGRRLEGGVRHHEPVDHGDAEHRRRPGSHLAQRPGTRSSRAAGRGRRRGRTASAPPRGGRRRRSRGCPRAPRRAGRRGPRARTARARRAGPGARPARRRPTRPA